MAREAGQRSASGRRRALPVRPGPELVAAGLRGLSCPHEALDVALVEALGVRHYRRVLGSLLGRFGARVAAHSDGLIDFLDDWLAAPSPFETVWHPSFGAVRELLVPSAPSDEEGQLPPPAGDDPDLLQRTAQLALRLAERGHAGRFSLALGRGCRLRWGRWRLPEADAVALESDGRSACLTARVAGTVERLHFERSGDGWTTDDASPFPVADLGRGPVAIASLTAEECRAQRHLHQPIHPRSVQPAIDRIHAARDLLARYAPAYLPWVQRVVREIHPVRAVPAGSLASGSFLHRPATLFLAHPMPVVVVAELLAHEATHLHFWLATLSGPCDDGTDRAWRYFSPYVSRRRSLRMMLLTYHAFANVALFYRDCRENGLVVPAVGVERERLFTSLLGQYERLLGSAPAMQPLGQMLWETVARRIHSSEARASANI